ncbi:exocyst complex component exo70 [Sporothrix eucalyptigena]|uniref:Exocyst complex protein EXO70 n=1 Tax=Sporothrix eucalyptigena TaxID=1812306 RepID=A0ABP0BJ37_9PEZI
MSTYSGSTATSWRRDASYGNSTSLAASLAPSTPTFSKRSAIINSNGSSPNSASTSPLPSPRSTSNFSTSGTSRLSSFTTLTAASRRNSYLSSRIRMMAVGLTPSGTTASLGQRHAAEEEARAEVDVLSSRLEKTSQLTKKIEACLNRLDATGKSVREVAGPLSGETKRLQTLGNNIESVITAIERLRQPAENKNEEEQIIRVGPEKAGLPKYLSSVQRLDRSLNEMKASNIRSTQQTIGDLQRLIMSANAQLEGYFDQLLRAETPRDIEPLHFVTKNKPFPLLSQDTTSRLGLINAHLTSSLRNGGGGGGGGAGSAGASMLSVGSGNQESPVARIYADIRGPYIATSLKNLAAASVNTTKKKTADAIYRAGTNGIGMYAQSMEGMLIAEYENICSIFTRDDWAPVFQGACQSALNELARTLRELNSHIKAHPQTDCYLAYEVVEIVSNLSNQLETRTGELKSALAALLKPVRDTAKSSLGELLEDTKRRITSLQTLPLDGGSIPIVSETMQRLQTMVDFLRPISSIMISLGDGGWRAGAAPRGGAGASDAIPSLASFDVGADGREIFAHYCTDTLDALLSALDSRARASQGRKPVVGVFLANSIAIVERMIRDSDLAALLESRQASVLEPWRKKATALYTETCKDVSMHLFDVIHTNRSGGGGGGRPASGQNGVDSASILRGLSSKDKENIKSKFTAFNVSFDDMVAKHRAFSMEREVRQAFARDIQQMLEPLYNRFWDRYHEIDKGKGKYVKYDKASISAVFVSLY